MRRLSDRSSLSSVLRASAEYSIVQAKERPHLVGGVGFQTACLIVGSGLEDTLFPLGPVEGLDQSIDDIRGFRASRSLGGSIQTTCQIIWQPNCQRVTHKYKYYTLFDSHRRHQPLELREISACSKDKSTKVPSSMMIGCPLMNRRRSFSTRVLRLICRLPALRFQPLGPNLVHGQGSRVKRPRTPCLLLGVVASVVANSGSISRMPPCGSVKITIVWFHRE